MRLAYYRTNDRLSLSRQQTLILIRWGHFCQEAKKIGIKNVSNKQKSNSSSSNKNVMNNLHLSYGFDDRLTQAIT